MPLLNPQASYFAIENPLGLLDRWRNRCVYRQTVAINRRQVEVGWTERAERELQRRARPLVVEMQLYFSCVVKKRILFHDRADFDTVAVNDSLRLGFRPVASAVCEPREFAANYPAARVLSNDRASKMVPRRVEIDCKRGVWQSRYTY